jgi:CLIP-associating protein 1/2
LVLQLKQLRAVLIAGAHRFPDEFFPQLRLLEMPMQASVRDLRSQVVREACVTVAYFAQELKHKFDHFAETLLPPLINLIPNSVKVRNK